MKIGKYPVKHSYKIARIISDVFSAGLAVFIFMAEYAFMIMYRSILVRNIGEENIEKLSQADPSIGWKHWLTMVFPAAVLAVFAVYLILVLKSHSFRRFNITKRNAQQVRDAYALCVSLCKIPALMFINEVMSIVHNHMLVPRSEESWFTVQLVLDLLIIVLLIRLFRHFIGKITQPPQKTESGAVHLNAVVREDAPAKPEITADAEENHTERS